MQVTKYSILQNNLLIVEYPSFHSKTSEIVMAQPAVPVNEDRTDLIGIPPFWVKASINPPAIPLGIVDRSIFLGRSNKLFLRNILFLLFYCTAFVWGREAINLMLVWVQLYLFLNFGLFTKIFSPAGNVVRRPSVPRYLTCPFAVLLQIYVNFTIQGHSANLFKIPRCACSLFAIYIVC